MATVQGAFVSSVVLHPDRGLQQGFERYISVPVGENRRESSQRRADEVIDGTRSDGWTQDRACPLFLWAHLSQDAHRPYDPPEPYRSRHAGIRTSARSRSPRRRSTGCSAPSSGAGCSTTRCSSSSRITASHSASTARKTIGIFVYESMLTGAAGSPVAAKRSPPCPCAAPRWRGGTVVDVMPTLLDLLGIRVPPIDGVSLARPDTGETRQRFDLEAYAESVYPERFGWSPLRTLGKAATS